MNTPKLTRAALAGALAVGLLSAAPARADGWHDHDDAGPVAFIAGLVAGAIASPYIVAPPRPVYVQPPVAYVPPPVYTYAPPPPVAYVPASPAYVYAPAPDYRWRRHHGDDDHRRWRDDDR